jgi:hypothetical protein
MQVDDRVRSRVRRSLRPQAEGHARLVAQVRGRQRPNLLSCPQNGGGSSSLSAGGGGTERGHRVWSVFGLQGRRSCRRSVSMRAASSRSRVRRRLGIIAPRSPQGREVFGSGAYFPVDRRSAGNSSRLPRAGRTCARWVRSRDVPRFRWVAVAAIGPFGPWIFPIPCVAGRLVVPWHRPHARRDAELWG